MSATDVSFRAEGLGVDFGEVLRRALAMSNRMKLASPMPASWNQIVPWLRQIDGLRVA